MAVISISKIQLWMIYVVIFAPTYLMMAEIIEHGIKPNNVFKEKDLEELKPNEPYLKNDSMEFRIFCYAGISKTVLQIWRSVHLSFDNVPRSYKIFTGVNSTEVRRMYGADSMFDPTSWISGQKTSVDFPAFSPFCVGISTKEQYGIYLNVRVVNYWRLLQIVISALLFLCAASLSRNPLFHYLSAVSLGVLGSLLVLVYIVSRFIPKKPSAYAILVFGYSLILYLLQRVWIHMNDIFSNYMDFLLAYCICAALISFFVCYRWGPVKDVKTLNIIQWTMQIVAVLSIYLSSEYREVSTGLILVLVTGYFIPSTWMARAKMIWYRYFPAKVRLLTEMEYIDQGTVETRKALNNLRNYCNSPDCKAWETVSRLKSPQRFAGFVKTGEHCTDQEILLHSAQGFEEYSDDDECDTEPSIDSYSPRMGNGLFTN